MKANLPLFSRFDGLNEEQDYTVSISTELDGKTITQVVMKATKDERTSSAAKKKKKDSGGEKDKGKKDRD